MLRDISRPKVEGIALVVAKEQNDLSLVEWNAYIINFRKTALKEVLVSSKGYGRKEGKEVKTSTLRQYIGDLGPFGFKKVELITEDLLGLWNEFFVSFYVEKEIYDKKYIFVPESLIDANLIEVPIINRRGVMIR